MSARHLVSREAEALGRHPPLELGWKKTVIPAHEDAGWHGRPCFKGAS
jgi:hypothetical protein